MRARDKGLRAARRLRMRRRILADAVQENLDIIEGVRRARVATRRSLWRFGAGLGVVVALLASTAVWMLRPAPVPPPAPVAGAAAAAQTVAPFAVEPPPAPAAQPVEAGAGPPPEVHPSVFPLAVRRIVVDPGHGGPNKGAISPRGGAGPRLFEKDLTLDLARRLRLRLVALGFQVTLTRDQDRDMPLADRARLANQAGGDLFVSIHLNWIEGRRGVETYYLGETADPVLTRLAASENGASGYGFADMRRLLDGVYVGLRRAESRLAAENVHGELFQSLAEVSPGLRDRGVKTAPFLVLVETQMPAILAEVSCLSDPVEVALLREEAYRDRIADALGRGLRRYADAVARPPAAAGG